MATARVTSRPNLTADIIPPSFAVLVSKPAKNGWGDEIVRPELEVVSMVWADSGTPSTLTFRAHLGAGEGRTQVAVEQYDRLPTGSRIRLVDWNDGSEWFHGHIAQEQMTTQASPQFEGYAGTAYGPELIIGSKVCSGLFFPNELADEWIVKNILDPGDLKRELVYQTNLRIIFNEDNKPNMGSDLWILGSPDRIDSTQASGGAVFCQPDRIVTYNDSVTETAEWWTASKAIRSLLEWFDNYEILSPVTDWKAIDAILGGVTIGEVDVDGLTLVEALRAILGPLGFGFAFDPMSDGTHRHILRVYPLKASGTGAMPYLPVAGTEATSEAGARGEVSRLQILRDAHNIRNSVVVYGERRRIQVALSYTKESTSELWPVWNTATGQTHDLRPYMTSDEFVIGALTAAQITTIKDNYHTGGPNFAEFRDIWRTFVFNEDATGFDFAFRGSAPTLSDWRLGEARIKRPIEHLLSRKTSTSDWRPPKVILQVGGFSADITADVDVLKDRAGIRVKRDFFKESDTGQVEVWKPFAEIEGATKAIQDMSFLTMLHQTITSGSNPMILTVWGSMESDEVVTGAIPGQGGSPLPWPAQAIVRTKAFREHSVLDALGGEPAIDDTAKAVNLAKQIQAAGDSEIGHGSIMFHILTRAYPPGTAIPQTAGRVINLKLDGQRRSASPVVRQVSFTFGETNITELLIDSPLVGLT